MPTAVESLRAERRRKLQVRESFSRGLEHFRNEPADPLPFYLACGDYLAAGQRRLIDQDRRLVQLLAPRVAEGQRTDHEAMAALNDRLDLADASLGAFVTALADLHRRGAAARVGFEAAAAKFLDVLVNVLGARSHSLRHLTTSLLREDDWERIVDLTPQFVAEEAAAFDAVTRSAPPGLSPEQMATEPAGARPGARH